MQRDVSHICTCLILYCSNLGSRRLRPVVIDGANVAHGESSK